MLFKRPRRSRRGQPHGAPWGGRHPEGTCTLPAIEILREQVKRVRPPLRTTYTIVTLDVSSRAFKEIYDKLQAAGYEHTFSENNTQIDMTGIAIVDSGE